MARQIKRLLQSELKHVSKWAYALILVVYAYMVVLQLDSFPMWFCSLRENSFLGFFPDPTLRLSAEDVLLFGNAEVFRGLLFNVAPLAHALFFPFIAACIVPRFVSSGFVEEPWGLSEARGEKRVCAIVARVVLSSFALLGAFILTSVVLYCLNCAIVLDAQQYFNLNIFCYRLVLAAAACLAYVVSCVIVVSYFGSGIGPIGMLLLVNVVAIYIQLGANSMLPLPSSMLMWICGVTPLGDGQCVSILIDCLINVASVFTICFTVDRLRSGNAEVFRGLLFNVAPLAHALFFPFIAACIVPRFVSSGFVEEPWGLSEARGEKRVCAIVARVVLSSFALLGAFILTSVVLYCLNCAIVLDAQQYFNLNIFCYRLVLAAAACLAYVVSCVIVVSYFGSGIGPIGMLLLVNVVAIYIQLGANSMLPLPSSMLMWICGVTPLGDGQCVSILIDCLINVASVFTICFTVDRLRSRFL